MESKRTDGTIEDALRRVLTAGGLDMPTYAVAAPIVIGGAEPELLLEVRAAHIPQAGDPCFPGGRIEPGEAPAEAASREMTEELGIRLAPARFLGQLPTVHTILGGLTDVFVCTVTLEEAAGLHANPDEVAEVLRVPMSYFLARPEAASFPWGGHDIWGMTAGAIRHLCAAWKQAGLV